MHKLFAVLAILYIIIASTEASSQVFPSEGSKLNYRIVGFSFPAKQAVGNYIIEVATGNYNSEDSFARNIILTLNAGGGRVAGEVPYFGTQYTWRVKNNNVMVGKKLHHFSTATCNAVDSNKTRLRVLKSAEKYQDAFIFLDGNKVLYDMQGRPVWFMPDIDSLDIGKIDIRDIKVTPFNTITFMAPDRIYEISYNGDILWEGPGNGGPGKSGARYHHQFTRLGNGHYMAEGAEITDVVVKKLNSPDSGAFYFEDPVKTTPDTNAMRMKVLVATLLEYDERGKIVWSYNAAKNFIGSSYWLNLEPNGMPDLDIHDNGFCFDEKNQVIYLSFRDISQVIKIKYPEGNTLRTYGNIYQPGVSRDMTKLFCRQHCPRISQKGYLYMFNNNVCHTDKPPAVTLMQEPLSDTGKLKKVWEFECVKENRQKTFGADFVSGGSVQELPDGSILADMGTHYSKVFIVSMDKKELWSALAEKWDDEKHDWKILPQYRASIILNRQELEKLIWNSTGSK